MGKAMANSKQLEKFCSKEESKEELKSYEQNLSDEVSHYEIEF